MLSPTMQYLELIFPKQAFIPVIEAGKCISMAPQTTRNRLIAGTFPIETFKEGRKRLVLKTKLAECIDRRNIKLGRPKGSTKAAKAIAQQVDGL